MKNFFIKKNNINRGFTLVETLVALIIFSSSIVGMIVILGGGISNTTFVKGKVVATYLSQEGIELTRNLRDSYILDKRGWSLFVADITSSSCLNNTGCKIESDATSLSFPTLVTPCLSSVCPKLNYNTSKGFYDYSISTAVRSPYSRTITITQMNNDELNVKSTVVWDYQGKSYRVESSENLFNWQ